MAIAFTPTERRLLEVLKDGQPHRHFDLYKAIDGDNPHTVARPCLWTHVSRLRKKLRRQNMDIVAQLLHRQVHYRWVQLLAKG